MGACLGACSMPAIPILKSGQIKDSAHQQKEQSKACWLTLPRQAAAAGLRGNAATSGPRAPPQQQQQQPHVYAVREAGAALPHAGQPAAPVQAACQRRTGSCCWSSLGEVQLDIKTSTLRRGRCRRRRKRIGRPCLLMRWVRLGQGQGKE